MSRSTRVALIFAGLALGPAAPAMAQTVTANLAVGATVAKNCSISTTAVAFGRYDTRIDLGLGANASGTTCRMKGTTDFLTYQLYRNAARSTVWGSGAGGGGGRNIAAAPSRAPRTFTVYGRIAGGQDVGAASYNDTVVATINF